MRYTKKRILIRLVSTGFSLYLFSSCTISGDVTTERVAQKGETGTEEAEVEIILNEEAASTEFKPITTEELLITDTHEPSPLPPNATEEISLEPLPPGPHPIAFQAEDGVTLQGKYFPGATNPSPIVVLMHWAPGDMEDWNEIAFWIQNRGLNGTSSNVGMQPWLDPAWFPPFLDGLSVGVFTFSFRDCEAGCKNFSTNRSLWLIDAKAALHTAMGLDGVDPTQMVAIGASIGADGAVDGCFMHNDEFENGCLGALSISPGDYLTLNYGGATRNLMEESPPKPVWCLWAEGDTGAAKSCNEASGDHYQSFEWSGTAHGMDLIRKEVDPNALLKILDFLSLLLGK